MVGCQTMLGVPPSDCCVRQKYDLILLTTILGLCFRLLNEYRNYDYPKYSFLTEAVSCYIGYYIFLPICIVTRETVLLGSVDCSS